MTPEQMAICAGCSLDQANKVWLEVEKTFTVFDIMTPMRQIEFLACVGVESGLKVGEENLNYSAERLLVVFPKYFTPETASNYARNPKKIANRVYAGHNGNGDELSGDGWNFRGRGWIQLTGRSNYRDCGAGIGIDLEQNPDALLETKYAALSAGWFWKTRNLNALADLENTTGIAKKENGSTRGVQDRMILVEAGKKALGVQNA